MAEHFAAILQAEKEKNDKYAVLAEAKQRGMNIRFVILYRAQASSQKEIQEEIGEQEGVFIRKYMPPLNTEIPHEDDWHRFDKRACDFSLGSVLKGGVVFNA